MSTNQTPATADTTQPQPTVKLDPETVVEQIRTLRSQIEEVPQLTPAQKRLLRNRGRKPSDAVIASSINVIGALDTIAQAIGQKPEDVRQLQTDWTRWTAAADELRALLNGIDGANLIRRQQLVLISAQAYNIGNQLARNPANDVLVPHLQEVKRQKSLSNRKKKVENPQTPAPEPAPVPATPNHVE
ncbi:MAG TPA: hypothetical protein VGR95_05365 [Thermoanaerobaculia bacterium]|nr:hypothetical protein [Thermoanaerobaculia bacterium]